MRSPDSVAALHHRVKEAAEKHEKEPLLAEWGSSIVIYAYIKVVDRPQGLPGKTYQ